MELFFDAYNFAKDSIWKDVSSDEYVFSCAKKIFSVQSKGCSKNKILFRLTGQSGSGKTSQLFYATKVALEKTNIKPMHIAVRNYATCFDSANKQDAFFREKSNGFALKVLLWVLKMAFDANLDIILEIALLDKKFEKYVLFETKKRAYTQIFQITSLNKLFSSTFILKREKQQKRKTNLSSEKYFYFTMKKSIKYLARHANCTCIVWSVFCLQPIYCGKIKKCLKSFKKYLKIIFLPVIDEDLLLKAKINFLTKKFQDDNFLCGKYI